MSEQRSGKSCCRSGCALYSFGPSSHTADRKLDKLCKHSFNLPLVLIKVLHGGIEIS